MIVLIVTKTTKFTLRVINLWAANRSAGGWPPEGRIVMTPQRPDELLSIQRLPNHGIHQHHLTVLADFDLLFSFWFDLFVVCPSLKAKTNFDFGLWGSGSIGAGHRRTAWGVQGGERQPQGHFRDGPPVQHTRVWHGRPK
jgi:hypothetical protein